MNNNDYYNGGHIINNGCFISMSVGNRSTGKSFNWKRYCVRKFLKEGKEFIYLRRQRKELDFVCPTWFNDISEKFPEWGYEYKKGKMYLTKTVEPEPEPEPETPRRGRPRTKEPEPTKISYLMGHTMHLADTQAMKGISMENIDTIFFDEFLPDNNVYLRKDNPLYEPEMLMNIYTSVARGYGRAIRPEVKIICVANNVTLFNPYFSYFGVDLTDKDRYKKNGVYAEKWFNEAIAKEIMETDFGQFIAGTRYGQHSLFNESLKDINSNIRKPPAKTRPLYQLYFYDWYLALGDEYGNVFFKKSYDPTLAIKYKLHDVEDMDDVPWFQGSIVKITQNISNAGKLYYENMAVKSVLAGFFMPKLVT